MNIFLEYKKKFLKYLLTLKEKKIINFPSDLKSLTVEVSPKEQSADMSCNVAMLLSKYNNKTPIDLADKLKVHFKEDFKEFQNVKSAKPGFLNFNFKSEFWKKYTGSNGMNFGISDFGRSAPYKDIYNHFGLNIDNIVKEIKKKI